MYLMISLRVRVQFLRDMAAHWMEENANDELKIKDLEKEVGLETLAMLQNVVVE